MNRHGSSLLAAFLLLAGCGKPAAPDPAATSVAAKPPASKPAALPTPISCTEVPAEQQEGRDYSSHALPVPGKFAAITAPGTTQLGVLTRAGTQMCIDLEGITAASDWTLSADERFLSFAHSGYETSGYMVVDRAGTGSAVETGEPPLPSPSWRYLAAAQVSEAAFGALEGIGVWEVGPSETKAVAFFNDLPRGDNWAIERWRGDDCAVATMTPFTSDRAPGKTAYEVRRTGSTWKLLPLSPGAAPCG